MNGAGRACRRSASTGDLEPTAWQAAMDWKPAAASWGSKTMSAQDSLALLDYLLLEKPVQVGASVIRWSKLVQRYQQDAIRPGSRVWWALRMRRKSGNRTLGNIAGKAERGPAAAARTLSRRTGFTPHRHSARTRASLGSARARLPANRQIDSQQPLHELGMDSLMAVEFRNLLASRSGPESALHVTVQLPNARGCIRHWADSSLLKRGVNGKPAVDRAVTAAPRTMRWNSSRTSLTKTCRAIAREQVGGCIMSDLRARIEKLSPKRLALLRWSCSRPGRRARAAACMEPIAIIGMGCRVPGP